MARNEILCLVSCFDFAFKAHFTEDFFSQSTFPPSSHLPCPCPCASRLGMLNTEIGANRGAAQWTARGCGSCCCDSVGGTSGPTTRSFWTRSCRRCGNAARKFTKCQHGLYQSRRYWYCACAYRACQFDRHFQSPARYQTLHCHA